MHYLVDFKSFFDYGAKTKTKWIRDFDKLKDVPKNCRYEILRTAPDSHFDIVVENRKSDEIYEAWANSLEP